MASFTDNITEGLVGSTPSAPASPTTNAPTPQPEPTTVAAPTTLTPPAQPQAAAQQRPPMQPAVQTEEVKTPGHFFKHLSHSFAGAILGSLAGPAPVDYSVDATGKTVATPRPDTTSSRLKRIAEAALIGLAAGSRVPPERNRGAAWAAGLGAGGEAGIQRAQGQDLLKRKQAQEQFEAQEKAKTDNAIRAMHIASTLSLFQKALQEQNDHDPERAKNMDIVNAANDFISRNPGTTLNVEIVSPEQAKALHDQEVAALKNDPAHSTRLSTFLPLGMKAARDDKGNPLFEQDGVTPRQTGQVAVISGGKDGDKIPLPQSFIDDLTQYGKLAGINGGDQIAVGQEIPLTTFLSMDARLNNVKRQGIDGWKEAKILKRADGSEVLVNPVTNEVREAPAKTGTGSTPDMDVLQKELDKGVAGDRAAQISAALDGVLRDPTASNVDKARAQKLKARADAQASAAVNFAGRKAGAEAGLQGQQKMWDEGQNPYTGEKLNLSNAPDTMMIDRSGQPIPFKMLSTMKPTQQENNRADFAKSTLHILDIVDGLRQRGKLPNGPITGLTAKTLAKFGLGSDSQEAIDLIGFAPSASTGAHVGGRFNVPIMQKMDTMLNMNMNDEQFLAAEQGIRDVMQPYAESGGRVTVGEYKANLMGQIKITNGKPMKVTGFDKNGNVILGPAS